MTNKEIKKKLLAASQGNADAFAELFEELRPMVYSIAIRYVGENDANDVVMDTYLKAWQAIPNFKFRSSLKTWLYRITYNCSQDHRKVINRHQKRIVNSKTEDAPIIEKIADPTEETPETISGKKDIIAVVRSALNKLADEYRVTLLMRYTDDMSYSEIAAATGVKIGTVMSRIFNGKRKLKSIFNNFQNQDIKNRRKYDEKHK